MSLGERGAQLRELLQRRVATRALVEAHLHRPLLSRDLDRCDLGGEASLVHRGNCLAVRLERELVLHLPRNPGLARRVLGVAAHVHITERAPEPVLDESIHERLIAELHAGTHPVHVVGRVGHRLLSSGHHHALVPGPDGLRRQHHGLEPRAAHLVHRHGGDGAGDRGLDGRLACRRLPHAALQHVPHDDFIDVRDRHARALDRRANGDGTELGCGHRRERAEEPPDRRARGTDDDRRT
jgi:hypothetical protein